VPLCDAVLASPEEAFSHLAVKLLVVCLVDTGHQVLSLGCVEPSVAVGRRLHQLTSLTLAQVHDDVVAPLRITFDGPSELDRIQPFEGWTFSKRRLDLCPSRPTFVRDTFCASW